MRLKLISYAKTRFENIQKLINELAKGINSETVHRLRVELKRIRFVVQVIKYYCPKVKAKKVYKPFKVFFDELGEARGEQVNLYRKEQSESDNGETGQETKSAKLLKLEKKLIRSLPDYKMKLDDSRVKFLSKLNKLPPVTPRIFVANLSRQLVKRLNPKTEKKELHESRHLLKGIIYASEISPGIDSHLKSKFDMNLMLELEDAIGDWHDLSILIRRNERKNILTSKGLDNAKRTRQKKLENIYELIDSIQLHQEHEHLTSIAY